MTSLPLEEPSEGIALVNANCHTGDQIREGMATNKAIHMARPEDVSAGQVVKIRNRVLGRLANCKDEKLLKQIDSIILRENTKGSEDE